MKLGELAQVACFSEFHFHRIFGAVSSETLNNFTNRLRLEKAARLLRYSEQSLTDIALDCGFSSSATFSRAFRSGYDTSPSQFRKSGEIKKSKICKELFPEEEYGLPMSAEENSVHEPEHAPALEIFLDKENVTDWSHFELELCLPVRKPAEMRSSNSGSRKSGMIETKDNKPVTA